MATTHSIRVVVVQAGQEPEVRELPRERFDLALEQVVGGGFKALRWDEEDDGARIDAYSKRAAVAEGLPRTCCLRHQFLRGTVVVSRSDSEGKPVNLTDGALEIFPVLLGRRYQAWNHGVLFEADPARVRVLVVSLEDPPRLVWIPLDCGGRITEGLQTLLDGVYDAYPLQEDADGGGLDAHVHFLAKESQLPKNQCIDGRWLHGTVVVGRRHPQIGFVDLTEADLEACATRFQLDLRGVVPRDSVELTVVDNLS